MTFYTNEFCTTDPYNEPLKFQVLHVQAQAKLSALGATVVIKKKIKTSSNLPADRHVKSGLHSKGFPISYNFPVPTSGAVVRFKITFEDQRVIESKCFPASQAKEKYEQALKDKSLPKVALVTNQSDDIFSVFVGNFDHDTTFEVETEYVCSLEYDTQYSGLRFSIPFTLFPRYGEFLLQDISGHSETSLNNPEHGIFVSVEYVGDENFQSLSCVSHKEAQMVGYKTTYSNENPNLEIDFVTILKLKNQTTISAVYEPIASNGIDLPTPALKNVLEINFNSYQLPELIVPSSAEKEIIFIIDRSGSMHGNIQTLKAAMRLFVSSFPNNSTTIFNIISFGSDFEMLWPNSKPLNAESFDEVQNLIDSIDANMGGTEILDPIKKAVKSRRTGINTETEIVLLTDGEVFNINEIREFIQMTQQEKSSSIRFFSLGIGDYVSHALLDAIAEAGKGCKQTVMNEERMDQKVIKLLKICLSVPITNFDITWKKTLDKPLSFSMEQVPVSTIRRDSNFFVTPELGLLPLTPTINSKMYIFFEKESDLLENVSITLSLKNGHSNTYTAPITKQVAATSENGLSYLSVSGAKNLIRDISASNLVSSYDKTQIGEAVGLLFGMTTTWTSLLAVEKKNNTDNRENPLYFEEEKPDLIEPSFSRLMAPAPSRLRLVGGCSPGTPIPRALAHPASSSVSPQYDRATRFRGQSSIPYTANLPGTPLRAAGAPPMKKLSRKISSMTTTQNSPVMASGNPLMESLSAKSSNSFNDVENLKNSESGVPVLTTSYEKLDNIVKSSNFDGSFKADKNLIFALTSSSQLKEKHQLLLDKQAATGDLGLLAVLVLLYLKLEISDIEDSWIVLSEKVKKYVKQNVEESVYNSLI